MTISKREIALMAVLLAVLTAAAYFIFFFMPTFAQIRTASETVRQLEQDLNEAKARTIQYETFAQIRENALTEWESAVEALPETFDDAEVLRRIQAIISPHTGDVNVTFPAEAAMDGNLRVYAVNIDFTATLIQLETILENFENDSLTSRVVNYNCTRLDDTATGDISLQTNLQVDYLTR